MKFDFEKHDLVRFTDGTLMRLEAPEEPWVAGWELHKLDKLTRRYMRDVESVIKVRNFPQLSIAGLENPIPLSSIDLDPGTRIKEKVGADGQVYLSTQYIVPKVTLKFFTNAAADMFVDALNTSKSRLLKDIYVITQDKVEIYGEMYNNTYLSKSNHIEVSTATRKPEEIDWTK